MRIVLTVGTVTSVVFALLWVIQDYMPRGQAAGYTRLKSTVWGVRVDRRIADDTTRMRCDSIKIFDVMGNHGNKVGIAICSSRNGLCCNSREALGLCQHGQKASTFTL